MSAASPGARLAAQVATVSGSLVNRDSKVPVEGARVSIIGTGLDASTDTQGHFQLTGIPAGVRVLQVHAIGFTVGNWVVELTDGQSLRQTFELAPRPVEVEGLVVTGREEPDSWRSEAGFEQRRRAGRGFFFTRGEIASRRPQTISDLLRTVPGVMTTCRGPQGCQVQMARSTRLCRPGFFLDGFAATFATGPNFPMNQIRGVEVYRDEFEVPGEFQRPNQHCGVVAMWTVEPGERLDRRP